MLKEKISSMSQNRQIIINVGSNLEYINFYEHDNYLELYKIIINTFKNFRNKYRRYGRKNTQVDQN